MVVLGPTTGFLRRMSVFGLGTFAVISGSIALVHGLDRVEAEMLGGGPVVFSDDVWMMSLMTTGEYFVLVYEKGIDIYDSDGVFISGIGIETTGPPYHMHARYSGKYGIERDGIMDLVSGEIIPVAWPEEFFPRAVSWPFIYGVNNTNVVRLSMGDGGLIEEVVVWKEVEYETSAWWGTVISSAVDDRVAIRAPTGSDSSNPSGWFVWESESDVTSVVPTREGEKIAEHINAVALTSYGVLAITESDPKMFLRAYDKEFMPLWRFQLPADVEHGRVTVNEDLWVVQSISVEDSVLVTYGFSYGDHDGNLLGERYSLDPTMAISSSGQPVKDRIVFIDDMKLTIIAPFEEITWVSYILVGGGPLLLIAGVVGPFLRTWQVSRGIKLGSRCPECISKLNNLSRFCYDCGHEIHPRGPESADSGILDKVADWDESPQNSLKVLDFGNNNPFPMAVVRRMHLFGDEAKKVFALVTWFSIAILMSAGIPIGTTVLLSSGSEEWISIIGSRSFLNILGWIVLATVLACISIWLAISEIHTWRSRNQARREGPGMLAVVEDGVVLQMRNRFLVEWSAVKEVRLTKFGFDIKMDHPAFPYLRHMVFSTPENRMQVHEFGEFLQHKVREKKGKKQARPNGEPEAEIPYATDAIIVPPGDFVTKTLKIMGRNKMVVVFLVFTLCLIFGAALFSVVAPLSSIFVTIISFSFGGALVSLMIVSSIWDQKSIRRSAPLMLRDYRFGISKEGLRIVTDLVDGLIRWETITQIKIYPKAFVIHTSDFGVMPLPMMIPRDLPNASTFVDEIMEHSSKAKLGRE